MKIKINGIEITGSIEEIKQLLDKERQKQKNEKVFIPYKKTKLSIAKPIINKPVDKRVARMRFINSRGRYYTKYYAMSYEKAMKMACDEYDNHQTHEQIQQKIKIEQQVFPEFKSVKSQYIKILEDMIKRIIEVKGCFSFAQDAYCLGIENIKEWTMFVSEFLQKTDKLCCYFNVPNKFKVIETLKIVYEK